MQINRVMFRGDFRVFQHQNKELVCCNNFEYLIGEDFWPVDWVRFSETPKGQIIKIFVLTMVPSEKTKPIMNCAELANTIADNYCPGFNHQVLDKLKEHGYAT